MDRGREYNELVSQEAERAETANGAQESPLAYATAARSPWPVLVRFVGTFGFALGVGTLVRMAVDAAGAFGIIDAPSLLAGQARHPGWAVWVLFFLIVTSLLHVILLAGSVLTMGLRPEGLKYLHTYAVASVVFVGVSVLANFGYFLSTKDFADARAYFLTIFLVNGMNNAAFPVVTWILLACPPFVAVFGGGGASARHEPGEVRSPAN